MFDQTLTFEELQNEIHFSELIIFKAVKETRRTEGIFLDYDGNYMISREGNKSHA